MSCFLVAFSEGVKAYGELWVPDETGQIPLITAGQGASAAASYSSSDDHKARTPPPDLPSLLLDSRIVFLGMPVRLLLAASACFLEILVPCLVLDLSALPDNVEAFTPVLDLPAISRCPIECMNASCQHKMSN